MKKRYRYLIAAVLLMLVACVEAPQPGDDKQVVSVGYDSEVYAKKVKIGKHEYYVVYASCDGRHSVHRCKDIHGGDNVRCFLYHSPDCFCRKTETMEGITVTEEPESTDPFDW